MYFHYCDCSLIFHTDSMIAAVIPKPPASYFREGLDEEDDDELVRYSSDQKFSRFL